MNILIPFQLKQLPGWYFVSNYGDVYSFKNPKRPVKLKTYLNHDGYEVVTINDTTCGGTSRKKVKVHRLVADAFVTRLYVDTNEVDHPDNFRHHNWPGNLEWVTHEENTRRRVSRKAQKNES